MVSETKRETQREESARERHAHIHTCICRTYVHASYSCIHASVRHTDRQTDSRPDRQTDRFILETCKCRSNCVYGHEVQENVYSGRKPSRIRLPDLSKAVFHQEYDPLRLHAAEVILVVIFTLVPSPRIAIWVPCRAALWRDSSGQVVLLRVP